MFNLELKSKINLGQVCEIAVVAIGCLAFAGISEASKGHGGAVEAGEALAPRTDVLSIGPDGKRLFYYCDGNEVVVQNCEKEIAVNSRKDCQNKDGGKPVERRIAKKTFEAAILSQVTIDNVQRLKPLEAGEVQSFNVKGSGIAERKQREAALLEEIKTAQDYLNEIGSGKNVAKEKELARLKTELEQIKGEIEAGKNVEAAISKVNGELATLTKQVCDGQLHKVGNKNDQDTFMASVLAQFSPEFPCGKSGTVNERIVSCATDKLDGKLALVAREISKDGRNREFWQDKSKTGGSLIWGPAADKRMNFEDAKAYCAGLNDLGMKWELPSKEHFLKALDNPEQGKKSGWGYEYNVVLKDALSDMRYRWFRSSSEYGTGSAWYFNGKDGSVDFGNRSGHNSVRCVSRAGR
jgi:hypothetical protein